MSFLYYLPGPSDGPMTKEKIEAAGLGYALEGSIPAPWDIAKGPDNGEGRILRFDVPEGIEEVPAVYEPGNQIFQKSTNGKFWIGIWNGKKPGPLALLRKEPLGGHPVKLADGNEWFVPVGRPDSSKLTLPRILRRMGDSVAGTIPQRYHWLCDDARAMYDDCFGGLIHSIREGGEQIPENVKVKSEPMPYREAFDICCRALSCNYRVTADEIELLELLDTDNIVTIGQTICDWQGWLDLGNQKKRDPAGAGSSTASGATGG